MTSDGSTRVDCTLEDDVMHTTKVTTNENRHIYPMRTNTHVARIGWQREIKVITLDLGVCIILRHLYTGTHLESNQWYIWNCSPFEWCQL